MPAARLLLRAPVAAVLAGAGALLAPTVASAASVRDVPVRVPARFLGGPIGEPLPVSLPFRVAGEPDAARAGCGGTPALDCLVIVGSPDLVEEIPLPEPGPGSGIEPPPDDPDTPGRDEASLARPGDARMFGLLVRPAPGAWLQGPSAELCWTAWPGAAMYVAQLQRGPRLVASARTRARGLRLPPRSIWMGRTFGWAVWAVDAAGRPMNGGQPIGSSVFGVLPRFRAVVRAAGRGRVRAQIRPRIPGGTLRIRPPRGRPRLVRLDRRSRFSAALPFSAVRRLAIDFVARGPTAPLRLAR